jgi:acetyl-CoA carboxylase biotin carboxyl carrier protein
MTKLKVDSDLIYELAAILKETGLTEIEINDNGQGVRIAKGGGFTQVAVDLPVTIAAPTAETAAAPVPDALTSPMVGTVYLAGQPGEPPFINPGDTVKQGDTLLIIEAMKVMNTIQAPRSGTVKAVMVDDAQPVEFGDPLVILV